MIGSIIVSADRATKLVNIAKRCPDQFVGMALFTKTDLRLLLQALDLACKTPKGVLHDQTGMVKTPAAVERLQTLIRLLQRFDEE